MANTRGHRFEKVEISGSSAPILGDVYTAGDSWHVEHLTVNIHDNVDKNWETSIRSLKRRILAGLLNDENSAEAGRAKLDSAATTKRGRSVTSSTCSSSMAWIGQEPNDDTTDHILWTNICRRLVAYIRRCRTSSHVASAYNCSILASESRDLKKYISPNSLQAVLIKSSPALPLALLLSLILRNSDLEQLKLFLHRLRSDPLFPVAMAILSYWLVSIYSIILLQSPCHIGDFVLFEDVYQIKVKVPLNCLSDQDLLSGFFLSHYRNTSAEQFVIDRQYNLFSGSRESIPTTIEVICSSLRPQNIFMAMLYRSHHHTCPNCSNKISPNRFPTQGLQRCDYCRREYRTYFNLATSLKGDPNTAAHVLPASRIPRILTDVNNLGGMLNVDIDLQWNTRKHANSDNTKSPPKNNDGKAAMAVDMDSDHSAERESSDWTWSMSFQADESMRYKPDERLHYFVPQSQDLEVGVTRCYVKKCIDSDARFRVGYHPSRPAKNGFWIEFAVPVTKDHIDAIIKDILILRKEKSHCFSGDPRTMDRRRRLRRPALRRSTMLPPERLSEILGRRALRRTMAS